MGYSNLFQRKPPGASCNWVKEEITAGPPYKWWRPQSSQNCQVGQLWIELIGSTVSPLGQGILVVPPNASWWSGDAGGYYDGSAMFTCGSTNGYLTGRTSRTVTIDVMGALRDAIWASSISFSVYCTYSGGEVFGVYPYISGAPAGNPNVYQNIGAGTITATSCTNALATGLLKTVTVYDDGRITVT